jgi:DNA-binding transcriptional LysR family regulator
MQNWNANMQPIDWNNVRHFLHVVHAGSVKQAARQLNVNQTTVSRRINALEKHLTCALFERGANTWLITPMGEELVKYAEHMAEEIHSIERLAMAESQELSGKLRFTLGDICTQQLAMPVIESFIRQYPEVDLEIIASRDDLNLSTREADIALRATDQPPQNLVGKRITQLTFAVYGSQYFAKKINEENFYLQTPCITWLGDGHTRPPWIEKSLPKTQHVYRTSELGMMLQMTRQSLGIAQLPCALCDNDPDLYRIPVAHIEPGWGLWVLTHVDVRSTARVRIFKNFLIAELEKKKKLLEGSNFELD